MPVITHNLASMNANRQLKITTGEDAKSTEKLSSGYRINRAADDAAGLSISEKMRWQIRGLNKCDGNIEDGISLLKVADGSLAEVHAMLQRMTELTVQAANDTNTLADRQAIQQEINSLLTEIDRIGDNTEFNTRKIFQGGAEPLLDGNGNPVSVGDIPFTDIALADISLGNQPFSSNSGGEYLRLSASAEVGTSSQTWNLIYGSGGTSHTSVRADYVDDNGVAQTFSCKLEDMSVVAGSYTAVDTDNDGDADSYSRTFTCTDPNDSSVSFQVTQTINVGNNNGTSQYYDMFYEVQNTGTREVSLDFMFNADTAYSNRDSVESYYMNNNRVENFSVYTDNPEYTSGSSAYINPLGGINNFSIINANNALPFSENIKWNSGNGPDTLSIGSWGGGQVGEWDYYDNLSTHLGGSTEGRDIAFSLIWSNETLTAGSSRTYNFQYGIVDAENDANIDNIPITYDQGTTVHTEQLDLWIQTGTTNLSGLFVTIGEMNSSALGINNVSVLSYDEASDALDKAAKAVAKISEQRSSIGAQQNRLEHAKAVDNNTEENTQAAESQIRDTDMASEMVKHSLLNILSQAGQSMLAQANQSKQSVLQLFQ